MAVDRVVRSQWLALAALLVVVLGLNQRVMLLWSSGQANGSSTRTRDVLPKIGQSLPATSPLVDLGTGNRIFMFVGSGCPPCRELQTRLAADPAETLRMLDEVSLFMLTDADGESIFSIPGVSTVVVDDGAISAALGVQATPTGIAVDFAGVVRGTTPVNSLEDVGRLAVRLTAPRAAV